MAKLSTDFILDIVATSWNGDKKNHAIYQKNE